MKSLIKLLIPFTFLVAMSGCVVAPAGYYRHGYYGPRVAVGYPRVGYVGPRVWGYGGWGYGYRGYGYHGYGHPAWGYGGGYHYHR